MILSLPGFNAMKSLENYPRQSVCVNQVILGRLSIEQGILSAFFITS